MKNPQNILWFILHKHLKLNRENRMKRPLRNLIIASLFATTSLITLSTHAAAAKEQTIEKLMQISDIKGLIKEANQELKPMFDAQAQAILKDALKTPSLNAEQILAAEQISALMSKMSSDILEDPRFYTLLKTSFQNTFTEEEAQANIQFLSTPIGQSINKKSAALMGDVMRQSQALAEQSFQNPEKRDSFMQSIHAILQPLLAEKTNK